MTGIGRVITREDLELLLRADKKTLREVNSEIVTGEFKGNLAPLHGPFLFAISNDISEEEMKEMIEVYSPSHADSYAIGERIYLKSDITIGTLIHSQPTSFLEYRIVSVQYFGES
jgi:hypothetical protein